MDRERIRIGASEAAAALGLSPYQSRLEWYARKLGHLDAFEGNEATAIGQCLERGVADLFVRGHRSVVLQPGVPLRHPEQQWLAATPDFMFDAADGEVVLLEIKTAGLARWIPPDVLAQQWGPEGSEQIPIGYEVQVQQQILVVDAVLRSLDLGFCRRAIVKALLPGRGAPEYTIAADADAQRMLLDGLSEMVEQHLVPEVPPPPDPTADDWRLRELLVARKASGKTVRPATEDEVALVEQWRQAKRERAAAELRAAELRTRIVEALGETWALELPFGRVSYSAGRESARLRKAAAFDELLEWVRSSGDEQARAALDEVIRRNTRPVTTGRRMLARWNDEEEVEE